MPFSLRQVCLWSSVWLPTGNQVCCCSHGFDNPASVPCHCGHHPGSAGVVCGGAWVALWSRWDVIYTCVEQKTLCPQFEFVFVCVLLCPPNSDMIAFSNLLPSSSPWAQQTPSPLLWNSPHILRSVSLILHPLSTGYPVSSPCLPASCLKQENKIARQPPHPPHPPTATGSLSRPLMHKQIVKVSIKMSEKGMHEELVNVCQPGVTRGECLQGGQTLDRSSWSVNRRKSVTVITVLIIHLVFV